MGRPSGGDEENAIEVKGVGCRSGNFEVSEVNGIKGTAVERDVHGIATGVSRDSRSRALIRCLSPSIPSPVTDEIATKGRARSRQKASSLSRRSGTWAASLFVATTIIGLPTSPLGITAQLAHNHLVVADRIALTDAADVDEVHQ